jgi:hypothetical protein
MSVASATWERINATCLDTMSALGFADILFHFIPKLWRGTIRSSGMLAWCSSGCPLDSPGFEAMT